MNFIITRYIYPLKEKVVLSQKLGFHLDNPRTEHEIQLIKEYWEKAYLPLVGNKAFSINGETFFSFEPYLIEFKEKFAVQDEYIAKIFQEYTEKDFFGFLARITVLAYFDDGGETISIDNEVQALKSEGKEHVFVLLDNENPLVANSKKLVQYSFLLSLLFQNEHSDYNGLSFLLHDETYQPSKSYDDYANFGALMSYFIAFGHNLLRYGENFDDSDDRTWLFWPVAKDLIFEQCNLIENAIQEGLADKLLYIGNVLQIAQHTTDIKVRIVMLTSIIELLLTHNPATNRFNVDDSINKQFQLKTSILVYLNDKSKDLNTVKKRLQTIYQQRSNIAHGNFGELEKHVRGLPKKQENKESLSDLVSDLYFYLRAILDTYLRDRQFVEFLKDM
jgi:hypothetical protein